MSINKRIFVCTVLLALVAFMFYIFNNREADGFISGWELCIYFDDNGNYKSAEVSYFD